MKVLLDWAAQSPHMNIPELIWATMKARARKRKTKNPEDLWVSWVGAVLQTHVVIQDMKSGSHSTAASFTDIRQHSFVFEVNYLFHFHICLCR